MTRLARATLVLAAAVGARLLQLHVQDKRSEARGEGSWSTLMREVRHAQKAGFL